MHRDGKVCWAGFALTSITVASVVTATILFTVFPKDYKSSVFNFDPRNVVRAEPDEKIDRFDHRSHSVPGGIYEAIDYEDKRRVKVKLDGSRSHTHYVEEGPPLVNGHIVNFVWFNNATHEVLGLGVNPEIYFPVGTTVLGLTVADNTRDTQTDFTKVIIKEPIVRGVYCYFYDKAAINEDIRQGPRALDARQSTSINFNSLSDFPNAVVANRQFTARCVFLADVLKGMTFKFNQAGALKFILDGKRLLETNSPNPSVTYDGKSARVFGQVIYTGAGRSARLQMTSGIGEYRYDVSKNVPVITDIEPRSSTLEGGGKAKITGISLGNSVDVFFGNRKAEYDEDLIDKEGRSMFVIVPKVSNPEDLYVYVKNRNGESNKVPFQFSETGKAPIKFTQTTLTKSGSPFRIDQITGIKYGPDHRYYVSTYSSRVYSFRVSRDLQVGNDVCKSKVLGANKIALGLAFNYALQQPRLYVSTSVLYWRKNGYLSGPFAWANGQIHVMQPARGGPCLVEAPNSPIITGLPVSNYDHGVNGLVFDDDGHLHIQVGGTTNAGHNQADSALGGIDESPLSGASLIAYVGKSNFDGHVKYSIGDPGTTRKIGGRDVKVYMSGWRNSFGINIHSSGTLYATDNGASRPFGEMSTSCTSNGPLPGSTNLSDKLGKVKEGKYFGHPNRNRGRSDKRECKFMGENEDRNEHYESPVATLESSTNGIVEYTANTFDGQLKGDLLLSKYAADKSPGKIFRIQLDDDGEAKDDEELFWEVSGLSIETSPYGDIVSPQLWKGVIVVLKPITARSQRQEFRAVMPPRGSHKGGNTVLVTGENIGLNPHATFNGKPCTEVKEVTRTGFKCKVPPANRPGERARVVIVSQSAPNSESKGFDYKYMNI